MLTFFVIERANLRMNILLVLTDAFVMQMAVDSYLNTL